MALALLLALLKTLAVGPGGPYYWEHGHRAAVTPCGTMLRFFIQQVDACVSARAKANSTSPVRGVKREKSVADCLSTLLPQLVSLTTNADLLRFFYDAEPHPVAAFRLPGCCTSGACAPGRRGGQVYQGDIVWRKKGAEPCLWGNMPYGKLVTIVLAMRAFGITHVIESGRMGGISALHYSRLGYNVTSVELIPVGEVEADLHALAPGIRTLNGDGMVLVPRALADIRAADPAARVAVILDGPKDEMAVRLATSTRLRADASLVLFDDQAVRVEKWALPMAYSSHEAIRNVLPMKRDLALHLEPQSAIPVPPGSHEPSYYFNARDVITIALGQRWRDDFSSRCEARARPRQ